jgi:phage tail protein X
MRTAIGAALSLRHVEPGHTRGAVEAIHLKAVESLQMFGQPLRGASSCHLLDFAAQLDTENLRLSVSHPVAPNDRMIRHR